jgi:hypothetical protein
MTIEQFKEQIKKRDPFANLSNYLMATGFIMAGFYFYAQILTTSKSDAAYVLLVIPTILVAMGFYGFWRIPRTHDVVMIQSKVDAKVKLKIIQNYLSGRKSEAKPNKTKSLEATYVNEFGNKVDLLFYVDSQKILFNVQKGNQFRYGRMFDFGVTRRSSEIIQSYLTENLAAALLRK